jgi:cytochrome c peroxidase
LFRTNDGSNCDHNINVSTVDGRAQAYSLLLNRGLIRIALAVPAGAEFEVVDVRNPYHCNETDTLSMYRRPLPSTNLRFLSAVMWDGRESTPPSTQKIAYDTNLVDLLSDLRHQSVDATIGHAQGAFPLSVTLQDEIVAFETSLYTAQAVDEYAGDLNANGATGGPDALVSQPFYIGSNDPLGLNPKGIPFTSTVFNLFNSFAKSNGKNHRDDLYPPNDEEDRGDDGANQRASIARGQTLFNTRPINIEDVGGLNDVLGLPVIQGTCGTCHDSFNVGNHSIAVPLNIGVSDPNSPLDVNYLPVITLRNKSTGAVIRTTDPGRAMITGKWEDVSKVKGPILRGLSSRAPYFHNGSASTLAEVVEFYDRRFDLNLTPREKADLVAFLGAL